MLVLASWNACFLKNHQPTAKDDLNEKREGYYISKAI
jgi:hypothetical protein